ncbi:MAG: hypothetical protein QOF44_6009, partial [Streptomyces sp.]|nr:hypothetical protein [Streptomyces sp.]
WELTSHVGAHLEHEPSRTPAAVRPDPQEAL